MRNPGWLALAALLPLAGPAASADEPTELRALVEKGLAALGGADKVAKYPASTWKGRGVYYAGGAPTPFTMEGARQGPGQLRLRVEAAGKDFRFKRVLVVNGDKGWLELNDAASELSKEQLAEERERMHAAWVGTLVPVLADKEMALSAAPPSKLDGADLAGVKVSVKGRRDVLLHFDRKTGLLARAETTIIDVFGAGKKVKQEVLFDDYQPTAVGTKHAMRVRVLWDGKRTAETKLSEAHPREKLPDTEFGRPSPP
jgi:hypothetical protein